MNVHALRRSESTATATGRSSACTLPPAEDCAGRLGSSVILALAAGPGSPCRPRRRHRGLVEAISATLPGAGWHRRRTPLRSEPDGATPKTLGMGQGAPLSRNAPET